LAQDTGKAFRDPDHAAGILRTITEAGYPHARIMDGSNVPQPDLPRTQTFGTAKAKNLEFLADAFL